MHKIILTITLCFFHVGLWAAPSNACIDPRAKSFEKELAQIVGGVVLYPMNEQSFNQSLTCLLEQYVRSDVSLAARKWDVAHAILRIMAADPVQFFSLAKNSDQKAVDRWLQSFEYAASWPAEKCPRLDPIIVAKKSIEYVRLERSSEELLRKRVMASLDKWPCRAG